MPIISPSTGDNETKIVIIESLTGGSYLVIFDMNDEDIKSLYNIYEVETTIEFQSHTKLLVRGLKEKESLLKRLIRAIGAVWRKHTV